MQIESLIPINHLNRIKEIVRNAVQNSPYSDKINNIDYAAINPEKRCLLANFMGDNQLIIHVCYNESTKFILINEEKVYL